ncbi:MAG: PAS domain S-box protein, partial [Mariprofundaceae bacterium]
MQASLRARIGQSRLAPHLWLATAALGLTLTGLGVAWSMLHTQDRELAVFDFRSQTHVLRLQQTLAHARNMLLDFSALVGSEFEPDAEHPLTYDELVNFTDLYKLQHPLLTGLAWSQLTNQKNYPALLDEIRDSIAGDTAPRFTEPEHMHNTPLLPVLYANGAGLVAGINLSDQPHLLPLIEAAMTDGRARAWIEPGSQPQLRIIHPVNNSLGKLAGLALGAWSLQPLLDSGLASEPVAGLDINLLPVSPGMGRAGEVYLHASRSRPAKTSANEKLSQTFDWSFAGLPMTFTVSSTPQFFEIAAVSHLDTWLILIFGLLLSGLASRHSYRHFRFTELLEREIDRQTREIINKENRFRHLMGEIPDAVGVHRHGRWVYVNPAAVQTFGATSEDELLQSSVLDRVHPDDRAEAASRIHDEIHAGKPAPLKETRLLRMDGSVFHGEVQGRPFSDADGQPAILVVMRNITKRKQAERELVRLRMAISQADDVMFITDTSGRMTYANAACLKEFGINDQEWMGKYAAELRGGSVHDELYGEIISTLDKGLSIQREVTFTNAQGEERIVWRKVSPVIEDGCVTHHVCVDHDLTEQRRIQGKIESTHRLESLGVMAGGIAHDFNNLLAAIVGNTGLIARKVEAGSALHTYIRRINEASDQAAGLCRQMHNDVGFCVFDQLVQQVRVLQ